MYVNVSITFIKMVVLLKNDLLGMIQVFQSRQMDNGSNLLIAGTPLTI